MNIKTFLKIGLIALVLAMFGYCSKKKDDNKNQKGAIALLALSGSNNSSANASADRTVISGYLLDSSGNALSNASIEINNGSASILERFVSSRAVIESASTDSTGFNDFTLPYGTFQVSAKKSDGTTAGSFTITVNGNDMSGVTLANATGVSYNITGVSKPSVAITGKVTDSSGNSLANANIQIKDSNGTIVGTVKTDASGNYTAYLLINGTYTCTVTKSDGSSAGSFTLKVAGIDISSVTVSNQTGLIPTITKVDEANAKVSTTLKDSTGNILSSATVTIKNSAGKTIATVKTDSSGKYTALLPAGEIYSISVTNSSGTAVGTATMTVSGVTTTDVAVSNASGLSITIGGVSNDTVAT